MPPLPICGGVTFLLIADHTSGVDNPLRSAGRHASGEQFREETAVLFRARTSATAGELFIGDSFPVCFQVSVPLRIVRDEEHSQP